MRVLWITERFPPDRGGAAVSALRQVRSLAPVLDGLDVLRLTSDLPEGRTDSSPGEGYTLHRVGRARESDESQQLLLAAGRELVSSSRSAVIHGFYAVPAGHVAVILGRLTGVPSVISLRGNDVDRSLFHGARLPLLSSALRLADAVLGVSSEILESATLVAQRKDGFHLVPNAVDSGVFQPGLPLPEDASRLLADAPRPWLAFTGELRLKKGLPLLLELAEAMAAMSLGTLVLVGGIRGGRGESTKGMGTLSARGRARIREVPWSDDTRRLAALYGAMDLFVFPSLWEGMPNALLESMACARPSLATAVGGVAEVVENGISGFLLQRGEIGRFVAEAVRLAQESATLERVGRAARVRVVTTFTPDRERDGILEVYRKLAR